MLDPCRWFTDTQINNFHWWWIRWRGAIRATLVVLLLASLTGGMCLTWHVAYDSGYKAAVDEAATLCAPLLKLFKPGDTK